jgi:hypothetical protein
MPLTRDEGVVLTAPRFVTMTEAQRTEAVRAIAALVGFVRDAVPPAAAVLEGPPEGDVC